MLEELLDACTPEWRDHLRPGASGPMAFIADANTFALGGYVDNTPAGLLWGVHIRRPDGSVMTYVDELDVAVEHRRKGIATMLMEAALDVARRKGSAVLWLVTRSTNDPARSLYAGLGGVVLQAEGKTQYHWDL